jgi:hypothetical protein
LIGHHLQIEVQSCSHCGEVSFVPDSNAIAEEALELRFQNHCEVDEPGPEKQRQSEIMPERHEGENREKRKETVGLTTEGDVKVSKDILKGFRQKEMCIMVKIFFIWIELSTLSATS